MFQSVKSRSEWQLCSLGPGADAESHALACWKSHRYVTKCVVAAVLACSPWPPGSTMETWSRRRGKFLSGPRDLCIEIVWMSRLHSTSARIFDIFSKESAPFHPGGSHAIVHMYVHVCTCMYVCMYIYMYITCCMYVCCM